MNMVHRNNMLETLKSKIPESILNIKKLYNVRHRNNNAVKGIKFEMQPLLKLLDAHHYISRYMVCIYMEKLFEIYFRLILIPSCCLTFFSLY